MSGSLRNRRPLELFKPPGNSENAGRIRAEGDGAGPGLETPCGYVALTERLEDEVVLQGRLMYRRPVFGELSSP